MAGRPLKSAAPPLPDGSQAFIAHAVSLSIHWPGPRTREHFSYHQASDGQYRGLPPPPSSRPFRYRLIHSGPIYGNPDPVQAGWCGEATGCRRRHWLARNRDGGYEISGCSIYDRLLSST